MRRSTVLLAFLVLNAACHTTPERFDVIIRGGQVYDGADTNAQRLDIGITGDRIVALGNLANASASHEIDASGLVVAPGFIDAQSRSGTTLLADGQGESHVRQGITTAIIGDVDSPAFWTDETADVATLKPFAIAFDWTDVDGYFDRLLQRGTAINVGTLVPLSATNGSTADVERAMRRGALGLSIVWGDRLFRAISTDQLIALGKVVAAHEGVLAAQFESPDHVLQALEETLAVASAAAVPLVIYQPPVVDEPTLTRVVARVREARAHGTSVSTTMTPTLEQAPPTRMSWLRDSGASIGSQSAAMRVGSPLNGKTVQARAYGAFATVLARYSREENVISLGDAIRRMTSTPAAQFRIEARGIIRTGFAADVVVFDLDAMNAPSSVEESGQYATGIRHVIVNGVPVLDLSGLTGSRPGRAVLGRARVTTAPTS
jgi:N-acyl-D-amino-acid deacylase